MNVIELKKQYNALLMRFVKAEIYFDNEMIALEEKERQVENFRKLIDEMNYLIMKLKAECVPVTTQDILNGFYYKEVV